MKRLLVPLDGSVLSESILPMAEALAHDHDAEILLVRALRPQASADAEAAAQEEAERYLTAMAGSLAARGVPGVAWKVWYDAPDHAIADAAAANEVDLVAMTTHGRGGLSRLLFGSVAESLVRRAPVPVILVRGDLSWVPGGIGKILVPLDGSELSEAVLPVVAGLAGPFDFTIDILHVVEPIPRADAVQVASQGIDERRAADAEGYLATVAASLEAKGLRVRRAVREGRSVETIQRYARDSEVGLIAMSTHGRSGLGRLLVGSVAEHVARGTPVPVLLWKVSTRVPSAVEEAR